MKRGSILSIYLKLFGIIFATIFFENTAYAEKTIEPNTLGDRVVVLQEELIARGYLDDVADGAYGPKTQEAVKKVQRDNGLDPTGTADEQTLAILFPEGMTLNSQASKPDDSNTSVDSKPLDGNRLLLDVKFQENLFLSKYDVDVCIDDYKIGSLSHGTDLLMLVKNVSESEHILSFRSVENTDVRGELIFRITGDGVLQGEIICHSDNIETRDEKIDDVDLSFIPDTFLSVDMEKRTERQSSDSTEEKTRRWCRYDYASQFVSDWNRIYPDEKIDPSMIVENYELGAEICFNNNISIHVGELDGSPYYEAVSDDSFTYEKRELFVKYANRMILASTYNHRFVNIFAIGNYPSKLKYIVGRTVVWYTEHTEGDIVFECEIREKNFMDD